MLYLIYRQHQDLTYKGGEGPIVHLEADLHATVQWANAQARRWAFTLSDAGSNYFEDRADLARLHEINWDAVAAQSWSSCKEPKQAEFLLEQSFPWHLIEQIGVQSRQIYTQVAKKKGTNLFSTFSRPDGPLLADLCRSSLRRALVKSSANAWSAGMQLTGQRLCKWVVKSVQFRN